MTYVMTFFWCIPSPIIWVFNAEAWVVGHSVAGIEYPWLVALVAALGQACTFATLYLGGEVILRRLPSLRARIERFDVERFRTWSFLALVVASVVGLPPLVLLALLAKTLHYRFPLFLAVALAGRVVRFMVLALAPDTFRSLFGLTTGS